MRIFLASIFALALVLTAAVPSAEGQIYMPLIMGGQVQDATATPTETSTATPTATVTTTPTPTVTPTSTTVPPICSSNFYNCTDFQTQPEAQAVFNYCVEQGAGDIHVLDQDDDGIACEGLPPSFNIRVFR